MMTANTEIKLFMKIKKSGGFAVFSPDCFFLVRYCAPFQHFFAG
ncbi:MAG: hypothetical protein OJF59_002057 [Cytophagales bacterium]|nr:MAG: hypothetical protein OJF59_002057 [Cytophagales bacterium]